ncbi:putative ABC transporter [Parageobacillus genomosp. 1]|uniref:ABC transporter n=2 Tax=Parageobacillus genomosp. 1 TaxID=1295642 RepID=A0ABC9VAP8_9BACL|nr:putative ABC transporter [Parageobacillus genomosp. 1]
MWHAWLSLDRRQLLRDPILLMAGILPLSFMLVIAKGLPWLELVTPFAITPHLPYLFSIFLLITPITVGMMLGLLMLEERDESLVTYFAVTPLGRGRYIAFRMGLPLSMAFVFSILLVIVFPAPTLHRWEVFLLIITSVLETPLMALAMLSFASNRLEGLAVAKMLNFVLLPPIVLYFFAAKWRLLGLMAPTYWISESVLALAEDSVKFWGYWLGGTAYHLLLIWWLFSRFKRLLH